MADSILPSIISAVSGLLGVILGGVLTFFRETRQDKLRVKKDGEYLAILVIAHLDELARHCLTVSYDDGTENGQPASPNGCHATTTTPPTFRPLTLDVAWKALPSDLMYLVLDLPNRLQSLRIYLAGILEYDDPPEYTEFFWARQIGYAEMGIEACDIAIRLRKFAKLPPPVEIKGQLSCVELLEIHKDEVEKERAKYNAKLSARAQRA